MRKHTANFISVLRIFLSPLLIFLTPFSVQFFLVYFICGLTDVLDGFIARKTHTETRLGARLDTVGDIIFFAVVFVFLFGKISLTNTVIVWFTIIAAVKILSVVIGFVKYKAFSPLHTLLNKLTGAMIFLLPVAAAVLPVNEAVYAVIAFAGIAAADELLIIIFRKEYNANRAWFLG